MTIVMCNFARTPFATLREHPLRLFGIHPITCINYEESAMLRIIMRNSSIFLFVVFSSQLISSCSIFRIFNRFEGNYVCNSGHELVQIGINKGVIAGCKTTMYAEHFMVMYGSLEGSAIPAKVSREFIHAHKTDTSDLYWNPTLLKNITFTEPDKGSVFFISRPLFSFDSSYAILQHGVICGPLCGNVNVELFRKIDGEWKYIEELESWQL